MPEASGSRVPAWPAFLALKARFTTATACVEVMPTPLSSTSQPLTSRFLGRGERSWCRGRFSVSVIAFSSSRAVIPAGAKRRAGIYTVSPVARWVPARPSAVRDDPGQRFGSVLILRGFRHVPLHLLAAQQRVDAGGLVEGLVAEEAELGGEFEVHPVGDLHAQVLPVAPERLEH